MKIFKRLIPILLRIEIGLPFAIFDWPFSFFIGVYFAIVNDFTETKYHSEKTLISKLYLLGYSCLINIISLAIGVAAKGNYVYLREGKRFVDYGNIKAGVIVTLLFAIGMFSIRLIMLLMEYYAESYITSSTSIDA